MDAGMFDFGVDVSHVFVAEDPPDVFALDGWPLDVREVRVGKLVVVVPDAVVVDPCEVVRLPVREDRLVIQEFVRVFVGSSEGDIDVVLEERLGSLSQSGVTRCVEFAGPGE